MSVRFLLLVVLFKCVFPLRAFAVCDERCHERLLAQITTLREEMRNTIPVGTILPYSGSQALPRGYVVCEGALLDRAAHPRLFETIGLTFTPPEEHAGTQFRVPNLGGQTLIGTREGVALGSAHGRETQQLAVANLPPHQHSGNT